LTAHPVNQLLTKSGAEEGNMFNNKLKIICLLATNMAVGSLVQAQTPAVLIYDSGAKPIQFAAGRRECGAPAERLFCNRKCLSAIRPELHRRSYYFDERKPTSFRQAATAGLTEQG